MIDIAKNEGNHAGNSIGYYMPREINTPSKLQKAKKILLTPVRLLIICLLIVLGITFIIMMFAFVLAFNLLSNLYIFAGGELLGWFQQRAVAVMQAVNNPQTTHGTDINNAINLNVQALKDNYGEPDIDDESIKEIEEFINQLQVVKNNAQKSANEDQLTEDEKKHALACLERIRNNPDLHSGSRLTLKQALGLVWKACNDRTKQSAGNISVEKRISQRKFQLIKHLIESQTEYGAPGGRGVNACFTGTFNSIISSLYIFEEFGFLQKVNKDTVREEFKNELQKKGEELFNQLSGDQAKKEVAKALSSAPATNFFISYIGSFKNHAARTVLDEKECDQLVEDNLNNFQYLSTISSALQS